MHLFLWAWPVEAFYRSQSPTRYLGLRPGSMRHTSLKVTSSMTTAWQQGYYLILRNPVRPEMPNSGLVKAAVSAKANTEPSTNVLGASDTAQTRKS